MSSGWWIPIPILIVSGLIGLWAGIRANRRDLKAAAMKRHPSGSGKDPNNGN